MTYFPDGEQQTIKDANGNTTTYSYDGWNRLNVTTFPDNTTETIPATGGYDPNGNVLTRSNRSGQTLTYAYNALNWMTQKVTAAPAVTATWQYLLDGRINELSDNTGTNDSLIYGYDTAGRTTSTTTWQPGFGAHRIMGYALDANGNRTKLTWPTPDGGDVVGYCYDNLNRMVMAQDNQTDCTSSPLATYTYDAQSRRTNLTYGNTTQVQTPDPTSYSAAGDLLSLAHVFPATGNNDTFSYGYTNAHEAQTAPASNSAWFWQPPTNNSTSYTPNALNQYSAIGSQTTGGINCQGIAQGLSYDCNGNLTFDGTYTYTYDSENHLLTANKTAGGTVAASYLYDPLGRRTKKSGTGVTTTYFLNDGADEVAEYDSTKTITRRTVPAPAVDEPIAIVDMTTGTKPKEYFHTDRQGSVVAMSDASGNIAEGPYTYDAYGNCFIAVAACSSVGEPYKFTGRRYDAETGLYYYRARYYDPEKGRFLQTDPVRYDADLNLYTYVGNDPTYKLDPTGMVVFTLGGYGEAAAVIGGNASVGLYFDTNSWEFGSYGSIEGGTGVGLRAGATGGVYRSVGDLSGPYWTTGAGAGPVSGAVIMGSGNHPVGGTGSLGVGLPLEYKL